MGFAQEVRDFTAAFKAVSDVLGTREDRLLERSDKQSMIDYRNAQRDKWRWDMDEPARERADIISFGQGGVEPFGTMPDFQPGKIPEGVAVNIKDRTSLAGMVPGSYSYLAGANEAAKRVGVQLGVRAAAGGGHKSHAKGTEWDLYAVNGWTPEQRVAVARGAVAGGADRVGLYSMQPGKLGSNTLHVGKSGDGRPRAVWGANSLTGGAASRRFTDPSERQFLNDFYGGKLSAAIDAGPEVQTASLGGSGGADTMLGGVLDDEMASPDGLFGGEMGRYRDAIGRMETGGQENPYGTVHEGGALGRYGVMPSNLEAFTKQATGTVMTPEQFLSSPEAQDKVFDEVFGGYMRQYGSPEAAALAWFTGPLNESSLTDADLNNFSGNDYVQRFQQQMRAPEATSPSSVAMAYDDGTPNPPTRPGGVPPSAGLPVPPMRPEQAGDVANTEAVSLTGSDPLPQTSGHMDAVSQAGNENMNPAAAQRVARGEGDNVNIRSLLQGVFGRTKKTMGMDDEAVATGPNNKSRAVLSGVGAAPVGLVQEMEAAIDPKGELPEGVRHVRAIQKIYNYYRMAGKPEKADMAAFALAQTYRVMANKMLGIAQQSVEDGDMDAAIQAFQEAYSLVPDGVSLNVEPSDNGTFKIDTIDDETGKVVTSQVMSARDIMSQIMQITPAEFDAMILKPAFGVGGAGEGTANAITEYEDLMGGDEAVSEGAAPDAEVAPPVPTPPRRPGTTSAPMGDTTIPADAAGVETAGGIQVASLDPAVGVSTEDPDEVIREEAVAETATGGDEEETEAVSTAPTGGVTPPFATNPGLRVKQVDELTTRLRREGREADAQLVEARFDRDIKIWNEYVKSMKTAEDRAVVDQFYSALGATPEGQRFDVPQDLFRSVTNATLQRSMQLAADAHNEIAETLGTDAAKQASREAFQRLADKYLPEGYDAAIPETGEEPAERSAASIMAGPRATPVQGNIPAPMAPAVFPDEDEDVLLLSNEDRTALMQLFDDANVQIKERSGKFAPQAPLLSVAGVRENIAGDGTELETVGQQFVARAKGKGATPQEQLRGQTAQFIVDKINNSELAIGDTIRAMAPELLNVPGNPGINNMKEATRAAMNMVLFPPDDPTQSTVDAYRMPPETGHPAGTVLLVSRSNPNERMYVPEQIFRQLDDIRQQLANEWIETRKSGIFTQAEENLKAPFFNPRDYGETDEQATIRATRDMERERARRVMEDINTRRREQGL